jgi:primosomal protein N'
MVCAQLLLQSAKRKDLHILLKQWLPLWERSKKPKNLRWSLDIDPMEVC